MKSPAVEAAAEAHTTLVVFAIIVDILEGSKIYGEHANRTASHIIKLCKDEQQAQLDIYDREVKRANDKG